ncbi:helix-turn-helix domain-containing protein [Candidatus Enterococcus mansonii]|uniref:Integrase core domain-containing protein n=1 Tax=Candidatus Enterococcus mansonii TaxID=1834181 RepID=A0A242C650_9ENTE|nr:helix-turn-helix domain-containing protein [Enterococcus sp. 4G2_DIV0659]OTO05737.1 integrase core domain-containing protein [Enterococcus sp. 4G2_DIV0659]
MTSYTHLTIREREMIFLYHGFGFTIRRIGRLIKRSPSTVMRELKRNTTKFRAYSHSLAQKSYHKNKQKCGRKRILDQSPYKETIRKLLFEEQWSPWQRGTNENTNGLIWKYLPKRSDMTPVSEKYIESVVSKLNNRPRKCLGWKTPYEIFYDASARLIQIC